MFVCVWGVCLCMFVRVYARTCIHMYTCIHKEMYTPTLSIHITCILQCIVHLHHCTMFGTRFLYQ